jgi:hypothetical protein
MKARFALAAAAVLSACTQMGPIKGPQVAEPPHSACGLVVDFGGPSEVNHRPASIPADAVYYGLNRTCRKHRGAELSLHLPARRGLQQGFRECSRIRLPTEDGAEGHRTRVGSRLAFASSFLPLRSHSA